MKKLRCVAASLVSKDVVTVNMQIAFDRPSTVKSYPEGEKVLLHLCFAAAGSFLSGHNVAPTQVDWDAFQVHTGLHKQLPQVKFCMPTPSSGCKQKRNQKSTP